MGEMTLTEFVEKWRASRRTERAAAQEHFIDLCRLLGEQTPNEADPSGEDYAFEKGATKSTGGQGWADVWKRRRFAWEYKGPHANLGAAFKQLSQYREGLDNPPLLVVCDLDRFEVHTNFTDTAKRVYKFDLADLSAGVATTASVLPPLDVLRAVFTEPERLRPEWTPEYVTEQAAAEFATLAESLRQRGVDPERAAHFLMRLLFCLFAEDINLLPRRLFTRLVEQTKRRPVVFRELLRELFAKMRAGGFFGIDEIAYFNGGLFADDTTLELTRADLAVLERAARLDWASVEPAIFGTLFERSLDPDKRSQLGAHYTSREDIQLIVEPVLIAPLQRRWAAVQEQAKELIARRDAVSGGARTIRERELERLLQNFAGEIAAIRVLDPACGSGNFLYVALKRLLDLEKEVSLFAARHARSGLLPRVQPGQLYGIEVNTYAHELASVVVWIGYIQWLHENGFGIPDKPILKPLDNIRRTDAVLAADEEGRPVEPAWPAADIIIGNPPFLGGKRLRAELGDDYVDRLFGLYDGRVPREADLVTYWFERARALIADGRVQRAGLLATQAIRGGANRRVLERIKGTGDIFMAWSDRAWVLDGAAVRVSMVGFDGGAEESRTLDGAAVETVNANLTSALDLTRAQRLEETVGICYQGPVKVGAFDIDAEAAARLLTAPNPHGRDSSEVVRPFLNASDITRRSRNMHIIDFGTMSLEEASLFEHPFEYVRRYVKPERDKNRRARRREFWWQHGETVPGLRDAIASLERYIATPRVAKHRLFVWVTARTLPDSRLYMFAREDDYFFGVLHSRVHEVWVLATSSRHGDGSGGGRPTYNNTTCFETFPLPWPPGQEPADDPRVAAIAAAARELVGLREGWLNPEGASERELKRLTLTNLYNARPTWLDLAHQRLDAAVLAAYGWPADLGGEALLARLLALNLARGGE